MSVREIDIADAFEWLRSAEGDALVTVLPDAAELGIEIKRPEGLKAYTDWFTRAAEACFDACQKGPVVFMQTDRLYNGQWLDKSDLTNGAAVRCGRSLIWHKIALRRDPGKVDLHRPTYSHVLAYGPARPGTRTPDVMRRGPTLWPNGAGITATVMVVAWLKENNVTVLLNPFCGMGTIAALASNAGLGVKGCELNPGRAQHARDLTIQPRS